jgi:hypothetical protein
MKRNILSDKLEQLYKKEQYQHPLQTPIKPDVSITGEEPDDEEDIDFINTPKVNNKDDSKADLGLKGNTKDFSKGSRKDLGTKKESEPKERNFSGPRVSIHQED